MITVDSRVPFAYVDVKALEEIVRPEWLLKITMVEHRLFADNEPVVSHDNVCLTLTTGHTDFNFMISQEIPTIDIVRCRFDLVTDTTKELVRVLTAHQNEAWKHYQSQRGRI